MTVMQIKPIAFLADNDRNRKEPSCWALLAALLITLLSVGTATAENSLESISATSVPGNIVEIKLTMSTLAEEPPLSFSTNNPPRIAMDFPDTASHVKKLHALDLGVVRSINAVEAKGRTRVVINLTESVAHETRVEGNDIIVTLGERQTLAHQVADLSPPVFNDVPAASVMAQTKDEVVKTNTLTHEVEAIDFRRSKEGAAKVIVTLAHSGVPVNIERNGGKIEVDFLNASVSSALEQRLDVVDFATAVTQVETFNRDGSVHLEVNAEGEFEYLAYQADRVYTIEVKALAPEKYDLKKVPTKEGEFVGAPLTLNFQDIEVRAVLQLIADFTGLNLVASDSVKGNVTLRLKDVPWDQALDIVLKTKGLGMRKEGSVVLIAPAKEIAESEKIEMETKLQRSELAGLHSELIQINYAKADKLATLLHSEGSSVLSERGTVSVDERTNTLMVQDTLENLAKIKELVRQLDIPVRQVLIEARIVIANDDFSKELGVRFGATKVDFSGANGVTAVSGSTVGADAALASTPAGLAAPLVGDRLNVDLPVIGSAGKFALAVLGGDYLVDLELSAMQAEDDGEVISSPRIITANQQEARIEQGVEIPYESAAGGSSGGTQIEFKKAVLSLTVTPQITPDNRIIMDLGVTKDSVGQIFKNVPSIDTREITTQVLVNNGDTVVLGGVYEQTTINRVNKIPFFGDLPLLGALFRNTEEVEAKKELLIFVTPKIIKDELSLQ